MNGAAPALDPAEPLGSATAEDALVPAELHPRVTRMVQAHHDFIWRLLRRLGVAAADTDDATQRVFMIAARRMADITVGSERSFLFGTALRVAPEMVRAARRRSATTSRTSGATAHRGRKSWSRKTVLVPRSRTCCWRCRSSCARCWFCSSSNR